MMSFLAGIPTWIWVIIVLLSIGIILTIRDIVIYNRDDYDGGYWGGAFLFLSIVFKMGIPIIISIAIAVTKLLL